MQNGKEWSKSKTIWVNVIVAAISVLSFTATSDEVLRLLPDAPKYLLFATGALNVVLRFMTNEPIKSKVEHER